MEWLPEGHLAYFVLEVVGELDAGAIEAVIQKKDPRGERPYSPRMMTPLSFVSPDRVDGALHLPAEIRVEPRDDAAHSVDGADGLDDVVDDT